jgi:hypothetical protein
MVGYHLKNTLSDHGTVSRGVCAFDESHYLSGITEITNIGRKGAVAGYKTANGQFNVLGEDTLVSMNIWGFKPGLFKILQKDFKRFLEENVNNIKAEFLLPTVINDMVRAGQASVKMLESGFEWFGVTYQEDKPATIDKVKKMVEQGTYPPSLWSNI